MAPWISTDSPGWRPAAIFMDMPLIALGSTVAAAGSRPSGIGAYAPSRTTVRSASAPYGGRGLPKPTSRPSGSVPIPSKQGMAGNSGIIARPA